jgi:hypothetical protein
MVKDVTRSSAMQRAGRAGREVRASYIQPSLMSHICSRVLVFAFACSLKKFFITYPPLLNRKYVAVTLRRPCWSSSV